MPEFAIVDDGVVIETRQLSKAPPELEGKSFRKILPVEVTRPAFDAASQVLEGPVVTVLSDKVTRVWTARNKTAGELSDERAERLKQFNGNDLGRVLFAIWKLSNPAGTATQFKAFVAAAVD